MPYASTPAEGRICGANKTGKSDAGPGICRQPAGWGTDHVGWGSCRLHYGCTKAAGKHAARLHAESLMARSMLGSPTLDLDAHEILEREMRVAAGFAERLRQVIVESGVSDPEAISKRLLDLYDASVKTVRDLATASISGGVAERHVQLAERQGELIHAVFMAAIADSQFNLSPEQRIRAPLVIRKHLLAIGGAEDSDIEEAEVVDV